MGNIKKIQIGNIVHDVRSDAYVKPSGGIPAADIASGVIPDVSQFITKSVNDLVNYYTTSNTYTKTEVDNLIGAINQFKYQIAASTSAVASPKSNILYLIGPTGSGSDKYEEYVYPNSTTGWTKIGDTSIDLSDYVTTEALNTALANYTLSSNIPVEKGTGTNSVQQKGTGAIASGNNSFAEGYNTQANGLYSHAEGQGSMGLNQAAHAEGENTQATGQDSHTEGYNTKTGGNDNQNTLTPGTYVNSGAYAHAEGNATLAKAIASHAEGKKTFASGNVSHAEGYGTTASGVASHAEGGDTTASGFYSHAEGEYTLASGRGSHAEGIEYNEIGTSAKADAAHAEGAGVVVKGQAAHGEGLLNVAGRTQKEAVAALADFPNLSGTTEQKVSKLIGFASHSEGSSTQALGTSSHAEGNSTQALVNATHAEGDSTTASGEAAHSEGYNTTASGNQAHAEGYHTKATANQAHAEGKYTEATSENAHAEGNHTTANGNASHTEGYYTVANNNVEHAEGQYNVSNKASTTFGNAGNTIHSVGIGTSNARKNAFEIMQNGDVYVKGIGGYDGTNPSSVSALATVINSKADAATISNIIGTPITFGGLEIAPGPLMYENGAYVIKDDWNHDSYNSVYGKNNGSSYFTFIEMGQLFEKADFSGSDGDIENLLKPLGEWRLLTQAEWYTLTAGYSPGTPRIGSTVNGISGAKYSFIQLTGVTHAGSSTPNGLLLFPDGLTITGKALSGINNETLTTGVTVSELNVYLNQGCVFLPASGCYMMGSFDADATLCSYQSSNSASGSNNFICLASEEMGIFVTPDGKTNNFSSVRLVRPAQSLVDRISALESKLSGIETLLASI